MSIKKLDDGRYEVDIRPTGRNGKRIRRKFDKKSEAMAFEKHTQYPSLKGMAFKTNGQTPSVRTERVVVETKRSA